MVWLLVLLKCPEKIFNEQVFFYQKCLVDDKGEKPDGLS